MTRPFVPLHRNRTPYSVPAGQERVSRHRGRLSTMRARAPLSDPPPENHVNASTVPRQHQRVLSGMRPTGRLHLGHHHGVLSNWVRLQHEYECFFFVADWHALTTHYEESGVISENVWDMVVDWLAAGIDPGDATLFIQSRVYEHAELNLLLSMVTPLGWLERVPSYKDQQEKLRERDLATFGFLGYPLLQSADILIYRAGLVPVGEDQVAHVELTREVARRFNRIYGAGGGFRGEGRSRHREDGQEVREALSQAAAQVPGEGRLRSAGDRPGVARRSAEHHPGRPRASVRIPRRRGEGDSARATRPPRRGAEECRVLMDRRCRSRTAT